MTVFLGWFCCSYIHVHDNNCKWIMAFWILLFTFSGFQVSHSWDYFTAVSEWTNKPYAVQVYGEIHEVSTDSATSCSIHCFLSEVYFLYKGITSSKTCLYFSYNRSPGVCTIVLDANTETTLSIPVSNSFLTIGIILFVNECMNVMNVFFFGWAWWGGNFDLKSLSCNLMFYNICVYFILDLMSKINRETHNFYHIYSIGIIYYRLIVIINFMGFYMWSNKDFDILLGHEKWFKKDTRIIKVWATKVNFT